MTFSRYLAHGRSNMLLFALLIITLCSIGTAQDTCEEQGTCSSSSSSMPQPHCGHEHAVCGSSDYLYSNGGTAQAYKPDVPLSSTVCSADVSQNYKYKAASWPFTRRTSKKGTAPRLHVRLNLWTCAQDGDGDNQCCCQPLGDDSAVTIDADSLVEVWQTHPDGTYSSLGSKQKRQQAGEDECRARVPVGAEGNVEFSTVAPGSTGILAGLGPFGWEYSPYGPPVIHMLFSVVDHTPLLVDLPALAHYKTLEQRRFSLPDWRGAAWVRPRPLGNRVEITSWEPNVDENSISIEVTVLLSQKNGTSTSTSSSALEFCPSMIYGFPSSFFLEPISLCAPSMLDFFAI
jgi:hypothetical protein